MKYMGLASLVFMTLLGCDKTEIRASSLKSLVIQASDITYQGYREPISGYESHDCGSGRFVYWQAGSGDSALVSSGVASRMMEIVCNQEYVQRDVKLLELYGDLDDAEFEMLSPYVRSWLWLRLGNSLKDDLCFACANCLSQKRMEPKVMWWTRARLRPGRVGEMVGKIDSIVSLVESGEITDPQKTLKLIIDPAVGVDFLCPR